jgi:hypothetical protein
LRWSDSPSAKENGRAATDLDLLHSFERYR